MSRRFSFFTEPRINLVQFLLILLLTTVVSFSAFFYLERKQDLAREKALVARMSQDLADAHAEIHRLKVGETKQDGTPRSTSASLKGTSETETQTPAVHAPDDSDVSTSDDTVEIVHTGPFKGLPLDVAKEIHKEYTAASLARAKRYDEWDQRRRALKEKDIALAKKELAHGDAVLADSKRHRENLLAAFALMSPEELEAARKEALKTQPAEEVDLFFRHVAEYGTVKSPEEIEQTAQDLKKNRESLAIAKRELVAEREQFTREWEELQRTKPLPPHIDLNEFYTEWKKRNSSKPSP
ncbi:MAG: hypothetical protein OXI63_20195 [Candidatus Poribacteria bacterium]|nr:hypothetical protein [Candidatus Poribacteria bacterium]